MPHTEPENAGGWGWDMAFTVRQQTLVNDIHNFTPGTKQGVGLGSLHCHNLGAGTFI